MKTIGMIGGMSWESTVTYYPLINEAVKERLGGLHSARCILYSMEFDEIEKLQSSGNWKLETGCGCAWGCCNETGGCRGRFYYHLYQYDA